MFSTLSMTNSGHSETFNLPSANAINLVNSSQNDNIFNKSELKAFADDKINKIMKLKFNLKRVENIVGKGENAGYQHFLLFSQCVQRLLSKGRKNPEIVLRRVTSNYLSFGKDLTFLCCVNSLSHNPGF